MKLPADLPALKPNDAWWSFSLFDARLEGITHFPVLHGMNFSVPIEVDPGDIDGPIPAEAIRIARETCRQEILCQHDVVLVPGVQAFIRQLDSPPYSHYEEWAGRTLPGRLGELPWTVQLSITALGELGALLGCPDLVQLEFPPYTNVALVTPPGRPRALGTGALHIRELDVDDVIAQQRSDESDTDKS